MEVNRICQGGQNTLDFVDNGSEAYVSTGEQQNNQQKISTDQNGSENSKEKVDAKKVSKAVDMLNGFLEENKTHAEYAVHDTYKHDIIVKIVDDATGQVIMEVPPKKILDMVAKMCEIVGVLFDRKA